MTLSNGSTILASDLNAMVTTALGNVQTDNAQVPGVYQLHLTFPACVTSTVSYRRKCTFVVPFDCYLETFAVESADQTASSTVKGAITGDGTIVDDLADGDSLTDEGKLVFWPTKVSGSAGAGNTKLARLLFDGTLTKAGVDFATTNRAHRTFLRGSTITVSVMTSSVATASFIHAVLVLREFFARE